MYRDCCPDKYLNSIYPVVRQVVSLFPSVGLVPKLDGLVVVMVVVGRQQFLVLIVVVVVVITTAVVLVLGHRRAGSRGPRQQAPVGSERGRRGPVAAQAHPVVQEPVQLGVPSATRRAVVTVHAVGQRLGPDQQHGERERPQSRCRRRHGRRKISRTGCRERVKMSFVRGRNANGRYIVFFLRLTNK